MVQDLNEEQTARLWAEIDPRGKMKPEKKPIFVFSYTKQDGPQVDQFDDKATAQQHILDETREHDDPDWLIAVVEGVELLTKITKGRKSNQVEKWEEWLAVELD